MDSEKLPPLTYAKAHVEQWQFSACPSLSRLWVEPTQGTKGWVIFLPGLGDFALRYLPWFDLFASRGWGVLALDWPGHGQSQGKRGDIPSLAVCLELVNACYDAIEVRHGRGKFALAGHSMGARVAIAQLAHNQHKWNWAWLTSPLLRPSLHNHGWKALALPLLARFLPQFSLDTGVSAAHCRQELSKGDDVRGNDSLWHHRVSARFAASLLRAEKKLPQEAKQLRKGLPLFVSQGLADPICPPEILQEWLLLTKEREIKLRLVELQGALHEPLMDPAHHQGLEDALSMWLEEVSS